MDSLLELVQNGAGVHANVVLEDPSNRSRREVQDVLIKVQEEYFEKRLMFDDVVRILCRDYGFEKTSRLRFFFGMKNLSKNNGLTTEGVEYYEVS